MSFKDTYLNAATVTSSSLVVDLEGRIWDQVTNSEYPSGLITTEVLAEYRVHVKPLHISRNDALSGVPDAVMTVYTLDGKEVGYTSCHLDNLWHTAREAGYLMYGVHYNTIPSNYDGGCTTYVHKAFKIIEDKELEYTSVGYDDVEGFMYRCTDWNGTGVPVYSSPTPEALGAIPLMEGMTLTHMGDKVNILIDLPSCMQVQINHVPVESWREHLLVRGVMAGVRPVHHTRDAEGGYSTTDWDIWLDREVWGPVVDLDPVVTPRRPRVTLH